MKVVTVNYECKIKPEVIKLIKTKNIKKAISIAKMFAKKRAKVSDDNRIFWDIYRYKDDFISIRSGYVEKSCGMYLYHYN